MRASLPRKTPGTKRQVLHLGNVGEDCAYRSKKLAAMAQHIDFHGIDLKHIKNRSVDHPSAEADYTLKQLREARLDLKKPKNLNQIQAEFIDGLNHFPENSLDIITSDFAVGYYKKETKENKLKKNALTAFKKGSQQVYGNSEKYTKSTIDLIYKKLKPKGKFIAYYFIEKDKSNLYFKNNLKTAIKESKFIYVKEEEINISKIPAEFRSFYTLHVRDGQIFRIVAIKE